MAAVHSDHVMIRDDTQLMTSVCDRL